MKTLGEILAGHPNAAAILRQLGASPKTRIQRNPPLPSAWLRCEYCDELDCTSSDAAIRKCREKLRVPSMSCGDCSYGQRIGVDEIWCTLDKTNKHRNEACGNHRT